MGAVRLPVVACMSVALWLAGPATADAYVIGGNAWPDATIRYHAAARGYATPVNRAARIWNGARVGVRFVRSSRARADVIVRYGGPRCGGAAPVGYGRGFRGSWVQLGAGCSKDLITLTAVHELGHVLGLDHEEGSLRPDERRVRLQRVAELLRPPLARPLAGPAAHRRRHPRCAGRLPWGWHTRCRARGRPRRLAVVNRLQGPYRRLIRR